MKKPTGRVNRKAAITTLAAGLFQTKGIETKRAIIIQFSQSPTHWGSSCIRAFISSGLDSVRVAGRGAAPLPPELLRWYRGLGLELLEGHGMSENFNYSHLTVPGRGRIGFVGEPHPGVECRLAGAGEIPVRTPGTMLGYYERPDLTAEVLGADGWLRTGTGGVTER
jgi:long-subunit acyl-CoA synthetase (AMP-forming)